MTHALASKWLGLSERMDFDNSQVRYSQWRTATRVRVFGTPVNP